MIKLFLALSLAAANCSAGIGMARGLVWEGGVISIGGGAVSVSVTNSVLSSTGPYSIYTSTADGVLTITGGCITPRIVLIGDGGSGGSDVPSGTGSGGGGAGEIVDVSTVQFCAGTYNFTIGAGGAAVSNRTQGNSGTGTSITGSKTITAKGGGGGAAYPNNGNPGGSGGGAEPNTGQTGGAAVNGVGGGTRYAYAGGNAGQPGDCGGGGGGAGAVGGAGGAGGPGAGGTGITLNITGSDMNVGGGAGGMCLGGSWGTSASAYGGGQGSGTSATAGTDGTGGGGSTAPPNSSNPSGKGGRGKIYFKWLTQ